MTLYSVYHTEYMYVLTPLNPPFSPVGTPQHACLASRDAAMQRPHSLGLMHSMHCNCNCNPLDCYAMHPLG